LLSSRVLAILFTIKVYVTFARQYLCESFTPKSPPLCSKVFMSVKDITGLLNSVKSWWRPSLSGTQTFSLCTLVAYTTVFSSGIKWHQIPKSVIVSAHLDNIHSDLSYDSQIRIWSVVFSRSDPLSKMIHWQNGQK